MRAVIIGNGDINDYEYIRSRLRADDYIICADGGVRHAAKLGVAPSAALGDFDSAKKPDRGAVYEYPRDKDFTDGELAVRFAVENGYDEIMLLGMTGSRLDHTLADIFLLSLCDNAYIIDDKNEIHILRDKLKFKGMQGKTLSIIPLSHRVNGIKTSGAKWALKGDTLSFGDTRGVSNIIEKDECEISIDDGIAIAVINDGE